MKGISEAAHESAMKMVESSSRSRFSIEHDLSESGIHFQDHALATVAREAGSRAVLQTQSWH